MGFKLNTSVLKLAKSEETVKSSEWALGSL